MFSHSPTPARQFVGKIQVSVFRSYLRIAESNLVKSVVRQAVNSACDYLRPQWLYSIKSANNGSR